MMDLEYDCPTHKTEMHGLEHNLAVLREENLKLREENNDLKETITILEREAREGGLRCRRCNAKFNLDYNSVCADCSFGSN